MVTLLKTGDSGLIESHVIDTLLNSALNAIGLEDVPLRLMDTVTLTVSAVNLKFVLESLKNNGVQTSLKKTLARLHAPVYKRRLQELVRCVAPHLRKNDLVLDVGCGSGALGKAILESPLCPPGVRIKGLERGRRDRGLIEIDSYDGTTIPYADASHDVVILADVLHHEQEPDRLFLETVRVAKRLIIIKDHQRKGPLAQQRISLLDWAANHPYGVHCTFRYNTPTQWAEFHRRHGLILIEERQAMDLYPWGLNLLFGRKLQYLAVLDTTRAKPETRLQ